MLFCSYVFVLCFLPVTVAGYFMFLRRSVFFARLFLLIASLVFYGWFNFYYLGILLFSLLFNYGFGRIIFCAPQCRKKFWIWLGIAGNLLLLGYFKYYDFFVWNINAVLKTSLQFRHILLPLGISFFTFQQISYLADICNGRLKDRYSPLTYALFVCFFPQLIAGPIVLPDEMMPQFEDESNLHPDAGNIACGIFVFSLGLAKKMLLADQLAVLAEPSSMAACSGAFAAVVRSVCGMFQVYFDFSGYCDMAIGIGLMFNILLPVNFQSPFKSCSVTEFWERWHITLGRFFSQFVYFPLGGSRKGESRTYLNLFFTFFISGLWHGAGWTFVLFGSIHGIALMLQRFWSKNIKLPLNRYAAVFLTFTLCVLANVMFSSSDVPAALNVYCSMLDFSPDKLGAALKALDVWDFVYIALAFVICFVFPAASSFIRTFKPTVITWCTAFILLLASLFCMGRISPFIYFNF